MQRTPLRVKHDNLFRVRPAAGTEESVAQEREASQRPVLRIQRTPSIERPESPLADEPKFAKSQRMAGQPQIADCHDIEAWTALVGRYRLFAFQH
ncbi:MAG: hypothetical protein B7X93_00255 [Hydrogenophilales bacterium 17-61-9]|nr:MAG: hypothetical protein B7X93_00255 [Hydrogenophilales bacterium 17-61-9]